MRHLLATLALASIAGCTQIHIGRDLTVQTTAVGCDVTRGSTSAGNGSGDAATQAAAVAAAFAKSLSSTVDCPDGPSVEATVE